MIYQVKTLGKHQKLQHSFMGNRGSLYKAKSKNIHFSFNKKKIFNGFSCVCELLAEKNATFSRGKNT